MKAWDDFRENRDRLNDARDELYEVSQRDREENREESDAYLAANRAVGEIADSMPTWQRLLTGS